jgi:glycosyltransferase involved in cell wall biosynthesis
LSLRIFYITLYPEKYPRIKKIESTVERKRDVSFKALVPRFRIKLGTSKFARIVSAFVTYTFYNLQILLTGAHVYWVTTSPDLFVLPVILKRQPYILEYRSPWEMEAKTEFTKLGLLAGIFSRIATKHASAITLTTSLFKDIRAFGKKTFVIPNYPQRQAFKSNVSAGTFRREHGVQTDEKVVLFVGRLSTVEGFDLIPSIVQRLSKRKERIVFWIVGDGELRSLATDLEQKYQGKVRFFGWQPYKEIPNFINSSDICIVPRHLSQSSKYCNEEGIQKISEFMFFGKPIVACGIAPSKEYLLVKPQDMANGILQALEGKAPKPTPRTWEDDCEGKVLKVIQYSRKH